MDKIVLGFWSVVPAASPCRSEHALSKSLGCRLWEAALQSCPHHSAAASGTDSAHHVTHLSKDASKDDSKDDNMVTFLGCCHLGVLNYVIDCLNFMNIRHHCHDWHK